MKKDKKKKLNFKNKVKGFRLGDRVYVNLSIEGLCSTLCGVIEDMGKDYIVIDKYLINANELINMDKI
jgi:hypothetical protein